jgi:hypothetical protein
VAGPAMVSLLSQLRHGFMTRGVDGHWRFSDAYSGDETVRAAPFDAVALPLAVLWPKPAVDASPDALKETRSADA